MAVTANIETDGKKTLTRGMRKFGDKFGRIALWVMHSKRYRNPGYFQRTESGVTKITVVGSWPEVVDAYKAVEVEVIVTKSPKGKKPIKPGGKTGFAAVEAADGKWIIAGADGEQIGEPLDTKDLVEAEAKRLAGAEECRFFISGTGRCMFVC